MNFEDEKDYSMRMIKEAARILFSLMFGKQYVFVEEEIRNKYEVSKEEVLDGLKQIVEKAGYSDFLSILE